MPRKPKSFAAFMTFRDQPACANALRFESETDATEYAQCLFQRWTQPTGFEIRPTQDAPSHRWNRDTRDVEALS